MFFMNELRSWYEGAAYFRETEIFFRDCDEKKRLRLSVLLSFFVDNAGKDYTGKGWSHDNMLRYRQAFLLSRVRVRIAKLPRIDDIVTVYTCERDIKGPLFIRDYALYDKKGDALACGTSDWLLIDTEKRRILRPSDFHGTASKNEKIVDCPDCEKLSIRESGLELAAERKILRSDLDANGHLYSARYADIVLDCVDAADIKEFEINYKKEILRDQTVSLFSGTENEKISVLGKTGETVNFICRLGV